MAGTAVSGGYASPMPDPAYLPYTFSIVGVQKAATTTLAKTLFRHPQIARPPRKELHFFEKDRRDWSTVDPEAYRCPRRSERELIAGDATPAYIFWPKALERMRTYQPGMRLIAIFRDPIERSFSHWSMSRVRFGEEVDWPEAIRERPTVLPTETPRKGERVRFRRVVSTMARNLYAQQLERGFELFPRDQWLLFEFSDLLRDYPRQVDRITDFLGVDRFTTPQETTKSNVGAEYVDGTAPTEQDIAELVDYLWPEVQRFAEISGLDVSGWATARVARGETTAAEVAAKLAAKVRVPAG